MQVGCGRGQAWHRQYVSRRAQVRHGWDRRAGRPFNLSADDIDDLVWQAGNVLVAEVDGDAGLLLLHLSGRRLGGSPLADVAAGVLKGGLCEGHDLIVRDGRGGVVAHCRGGQKEPGGAAAESVVDMLLAGGARAARAKYRMM
jgi:hypothetical protein